MSAARFIFIACTAFLVARVATNGVCSANMNNFDELSYEPALKNSINKFLHSLRDGVSKTGLRFVNTTTIANFDPHMIMNGSDRMVIELQDMTVKGFSDLTVTDIGVISDGVPSGIIYYININIPSLSFESRWNYNGTWHRTRLAGYKRLRGNLKNVDAMLEVRLALTGDSEYWTLTRSGLDSRYLAIGEAKVNIDKNFLHDDDTATKMSIKEYVKREIQATLLRLSLPHIVEFLQTLLQRIRWYAILFGKFDPEDYELYHGNLMA